MANRDREGNARLNSPVVLGPSRIKSKRARRCWLDNARQIDSDSTIAIREKTITYYFGFGKGVRDKLADMSDPMKTQMGTPHAVDPNRTIMGGAPSLNATVTIKPVQCPVCKSFNPPGLMFCNDCGLIFEMALDGDAFGAPSVQLPTLVDANGREHQLRMGANVIGRQGDVVVDDTRVSRRHAQVNLDGATVTVEDLGSTNGTSVGGVKLATGQKSPLANSEKLSLGGFEMTLSMPGEVNKTLAAMSGKTSAMAASPTIGEVKATLLIDDQEQALRVGSYTFGRKTDNDIVVSDPYVSGRHGIVEVEEDGIFITDTGSTNGTVMNDAKLPANLKTQLQDSDEVKLGGVVIKVRMGK